MWALHRLASFCRERCLWGCGGCAGDRKPVACQPPNGSHSRAIPGSGSPFTMLSLASRSALWRSYSSSDGVGFPPFHCDFWKVVVPTHLFLSLRMKFICQSETIIFWKLSLVFWDENVLGPGRWFSAETGDPRGPAHGGRRESAPWSCPRPPMLVYRHVHTHIHKCKCI